MDATFAESATDYAANALLYSLYNRDAIVLLAHRDIEDWRMSMKEDDINYWKGNLRFCKENYKIENKLKAYFDLN